RDDLLAWPKQAAPAVGFGWDTQGGELWYAGEPAEGVLLEQDTSRRELDAERGQLIGRAQRAGDQAAAAGERAEAAARAFAPVAHLRGVHRADPARLERLAAVAGRLDETLRVAAAAAARLEAPLAERAGRLADDLRGI